MLDQYGIDDLSGYQSDLYHRADGFNELEYWRPIRKKKWVISLHGRVWRYNANGKRRSEYVTDTKHVSATTMAKAIETAKFFHFKKWRIMSASARLLRPGDVGIR